MMVLFLYRCPNTGLRVQGYVEDADTNVNETREIYRGEDCPACKGLHYVNLKTGKVLGVVTPEGSRFMEDVMINRSNEHHSVLDAIANRVKKYREAIGLRNELANCTPEQVALIARDMGSKPWGTVICYRQRAARRQRTAKAPPCAWRRSAKAFVRASWHDARLATHLRNLRPQRSVPARSRQGYSRGPLSRLL